MPFEINKVYTFNTKAAAILGAMFKNAKLLGIMDYTTALSYDTIDLKYRSIYPLLPIGTPDQPKSCIYYRFQSESGERIILADQWIDMASIDVIDHINFKVTVNQASTQDMTRVRDALLALGFTTFAIEQI